MTCLIDVDTVSKVIKKEKIIDSISCSFEENRIYGLLGRNGAGKTTLMKMMTGQSLPTEGDILINGQSPFDNPTVQSQICFIKESGNFKETMKIKDIIKFAPAYYPNLNKDFALELIETFKLPAHKKVSQLSKGMVSALGISIGIASRAPLTIFDEPYIGMDAAARQTFYDLLLEDYTIHPRTIILSTHLIDEVSNLFQDVYLIDEGKLTLSENIDNLKERSFALKGKKEEILPLLQHVQVLKETAFIGEYTATIYDKDMQLPSLPPTIEKKSLSLQNLMVLLTDQKKEERV
ncbi:ABC transporter ATP-binding protein [Alkalihalophilus lindianensis]|uniref:ABC transporter ATP-binding protein n=1 Tax=Alkalihalophilus lindianensis TaxID=1630542 RepID=A0ABU3X8H1_9BACI|nr:ABC transporter ATP-binding protein [Alkalihalophilus lindianensis]MDV2684186.1 ABC transporter ATP-binding protein [Alkalihalophilus lindianensis]